MVRAPTKPSLTAINSRWSAKPISWAASESSPTVMLTLENTRSSTRLVTSTLTKQDRTYILTTMEHNKQIKISIVLTTSPSKVKFSHRQVHRIEEARFNRILTHSQLTNPIPRNSRPIRLGRPSPCQK